MNLIQVIPYNKSYNFAHNIQRIYFMERNLTNFMKRHWIIPFFFFPLLFPACSKEVGGLSPAKAVKTPSMPAATVTFQDRLEEKKGENGNYLLTLVSNFPMITMNDNPDAAMKINGYIQNEEIIFNENAEKCFAEVFLENSSLASCQIPSYTLDSHFTLIFENDQVLSFVRTDYENVEGQKANTLLEAYNFDLETGNLLSFKDIVTNEKQALVFLEEYLTEQMENPQYGNTPWQNSNFPLLLSEADWYFSENGVILLIKPGKLAPYKEGFFQFTIPYNNFSHLKEKYHFIALP